PPKHRTCKCKSFRRDEHLAQSQDVAHFTCLGSKNRFLRGLPTYRMYWRRRCHRKRSPNLSENSLFENKPGFDKEVPISRIFCRKRSGKSFIPACFTFCGF